MSVTSTTSALQLSLPVQAPVEEPIINGPFDEPKFWWAYDKNGKAIKTPGRRNASYFWTTQKVMSGQTQLSLEGMESDYGSEELGLVNDLRHDVARWRASNYENATATTKKLLAHWKNPERKRRLFFCQLEAVETVIYINEILASGRKSRWTPTVTREQYEALCKVTEATLESTAQGKFVARLIDPPQRADWKPLRRYGCNGDGFRQDGGNGDAHGLGTMQSRRGARRHAIPPRRAGRLSEPHGEGTPASVAA
ncbi:MAG: hypothetical protein JWO94_3458 [Verrucomicrobiaceae bacterium]|nr:hypothetical protein [Verrucomicrobiaceae bacterium]